MSGGEEGAEDDEGDREVAMHVVLDLVREIVGEKGWRWSVSRWYMRVWLIAFLGEGWNVSRTREYIA